MEIDAAYGCWWHFIANKESCNVHIDWIHALGASFELKMDCQGCKKVLNCLILHLIGQWS